MTEQPAGQRLFLVRLAVGLAQGLFLYFLYHAQEAKGWPATSGMVFGPLLLTGIFIPLLLNQALGEMPMRRAALWALIATITLAALGVYDVWSAWPPYAQATPTIIPSARLFIFCAAGLFIAHALVVGAAIDRRFCASYATHFDIAWKLAVQLALAILFVGIFWLLLWLGAELFSLIKLNFFSRLLEHEWFSIPVVTLAAAAALHLTDIRPVLVRGARTLLLNLLSWLLPLLTLIVAGFLASLPFTGLTPLWAVGHASALLLAAAAVLVLLINAAHQDGDEAPPKVLRWSGTLAAVLPLPLGAIALYALHLRVSQYGWTEDRVLVAAALMVAGFHAVGYAHAAVTRGAWLQRIENWNFLAALLTLALLVLLSSPLADPRRIAVNDQMARLQHGAVKPDAFDIAWLRRDGGRYGHEALMALSHSPIARLQRDAKGALENKPFAVRTMEVRAAPAEVAARIKVYPAGKTLPASFLAGDIEPSYALVSACLRRTDITGPLQPRNDPPLCEAVLRDLDGDGKDEIILITTSSYGPQAHRRTTHGTEFFQQQPDGGWRRAGSIATPVCESDMAALRAGDLKFVPAARPDIQIGSQQAALQWTRPDPPEQCPENRP